MILRAQVLRIRTKLLLSGVALVQGRQLLEFLEPQAGLSWGGGGEGALSGEALFQVNKVTVLNI